MPLGELQGIMGAEGAINELDILLEDGARHRAGAQIEIVKQTVGEEAVQSVVRGADNPSYSLLMMDLEEGRQMMG